MTEIESAKLLVLLAAKFPGRLTLDTQKVWAADRILLGFSLEEAQEAAHRMSRSREHPSFCALIELCRVVRREMVERTNLARPALPARTSQDERRSKIARKLAVDMANGRYRGDFQIEFERRLREDSVCESSAT